MIMSEQQIELDVKETGSANVSKGMAFGLEGDLFLYLIGAGVLAITLLTICATVIKIDTTISIGISVIPVVLTIIYLLIFKINKPPSYQHDLIDQVLNGDSFQPVTIRMKKEHPFKRNNSNEV